MKKLIGVAIATSILLIVAMVGWMILMKNKGGNSKQQDMIKTENKADINDLSNKINHKKQASDGYVNPKEIKLPESDSESGSELGGPPNKQQLIGFWKMVKLPESITALNRVDPWPLPYQWFAFYENGKVNSMMVSEDNNLSAADLDEIFKVLPAEKIPNYNYPVESQFTNAGNQFMTIDNPEIRDYQEMWGVNLFTKDYKNVFKNGDLLLTLDDGKGHPIYYRLLRRVK